MKYDGYPYNPFSYGPEGTLPGQHIDSLIDSPTGNYIDNPIGNPFVNPNNNPVINHILDNTSPYNNDVPSQTPNGSPFDFYDQSYDYGLDRGRWKRAYARVIHLSPNAPIIDIYLDGRLFYSGLNYRMQSDYVGVRPGNHRIVFYPAGQMRNPIFYKTLFVPRRSIVSLVVYGLFTNLDVMVIDDKTSIPSSKVKVKFIHLSPNSPAVDLLADRSIWFNQVIYQEGSEYIPVVPGRRTLSLRIAGTQQIVFSVPNVLFSRNKAYTIYAVGLVNASPPLQLLITIDGSERLQVD